MEPYNEFEKYVGKTVILTDWSGSTSEHFIKKNDIKNKRLEIPLNIGSKDIHYLIYDNIGKDRAVTKIELKNQ
jgi:hypothetical protein